MIFENKSDFRRKIVLYFNLINLHFHNIKDIFQTQHNTFNSQEKTSSTHEQVYPALFRVVGILNHSHYLVTVV